MAGAGDRLDGQLALVTGGGRGIGANIARELAAAGMRVVVAGRAAQSVEAVAAEIGGVALTGDVSSAVDSQRWLAELERSVGPLDLLVNNAGITDGGASPLWEQNPDDWWRVFEVNVRGAALCCRAALPAMLARGAGRIVNVTSGVAYMPVRSVTRLSTSYGPSKAALIRFGELLAVQLQETGISVFSISPGLIRTDFTSGLTDDTTYDSPALAPALVRVLASGRADRLSGRYLHAVRDDIEALIEGADGIVSDDTHVVRLRV